MRINHNIAALNTHRQLNSASTQQSKSMEKLASGLRINKAGDDAAGLAISEKMRGQIRGLDQASKNAQDGISLLQTAEGALNETHDILQRTRELAVQASNDTATLDDRKEIQKEVNQLLEEVDRISTQTEFNTTKLLGSSQTLKMHIGANDGQTMDIQLTAMGTANMGTGGSATVTKTIAPNFATTTGTIQIGDNTLALNEDYTGKMDKLVSDLNSAFQSSQGVTFSNNGNNITMTSNSAFSYTVTDGGTPGAAAAFGAATSGAAVAVAQSGTATGVALNTLKVDPAAVSTGGVLTQGNAETAIKAFDNAIKSVSAERSKFGAYQNRLEHTINNLSTSSENLTAAESRVRDVDYALAA
ncbi:flagellin [Peribacillus cavernae]|uniref:Flagellin n=1 Tax=Peribacillus cavernae TaxID=1674310 RepID=A0A433HSY3_9BACI|nr:flagellin [Peribacillus cavernae]MDQ0218415.1 flagellin [Peribacillus cavernae]RUQ31417.1 flagellin [Peribacillus cavernae]